MGVPLRTSDPVIQYTRTADGVRIAYYSMGEGIPLVVTSLLLWSHLSNTLVFKEYHRGQVDGGLGRAMQVVRYDARGTGFSDQLAVDFSIDAQIADLEAVLGALNIERFALFGRTHGAALAITYAVRHPERVSHLILSMPYAVGSEQRPISENMGMRALPDMGPEQWEAYTMMMADASLRFSSRRLAVGMGKLYRESMTPKSHYAFREWQLTMDISALLKDVSVPTLILSRRIPNRPAYEIDVAAAIPGARVFTIDADPVIRGRWLPEETAAVEAFMGIGAATEAPAPQPLPSDHAALTPREREVLALVVAGRSNREIADDLVLSERTVARHIANMYEKLGVHGRAEVTAYALRHSLV